MVDRESLNISYTDLERTKEEIDVRSNSIRQGNNDIRALQMGVDKLKQKIENLKRNATNVQAQDVEGKVLTRGGEDLLTQYLIYSLKKSSLNLQLC